MTQTKLLVITTQGYMAKDQKAEFTARAKDAADKVGAELLVLEPGQHANLFDGCVVPDKAAPVEIKDGLRRCSVSRGAFLEPQIEGLTAPHSQDHSIDAVQGEATSFMLDPLEQAIESTARVMRDELDHMAQISMTLEGSVPTTSLYKRMGDHLDALLAAQLRRVSADEQP